MIRIESFNPTRHRESFRYSTKGILLIPKRNYEVHEDVEGINEESLQWIEKQLCYLPELL